MHGVDHEHIDFRVIDLHDFERVVRPVFANDRRKALSSRLRSLPVAYEKAFVHTRHARLDRFPSRQAYTLSLAQMPQMPPQRVHTRLLARAVELQDRLADQGVLLRRQSARTLPRTASRGQK